LKEKFDTMMLPVKQDKAVSFIPPFNFIIPNELNMVEQKVILFLV